MLHDRFDLAHWTAVLNGLGQAPYPMGFGPLHLAALEQRRARLAPADLPQPRLPVDVFVFALGEPTRREVTKVGGLPYWPRERLWPRTPTGEPMTFVCQFCFADSRDIVGDRPGDVLLLFGRVKDPVPWEPDTYHLAWLALGATDLVNAADVPPSAWAITPCYGVIHRTWESPAWVRAYYSHQPDDADALHGIAPARLTKIGGFSYWMQEPHLPEDDAADGYLCTSGSVWPGLEQPWPLVNVPGPFRMDDSTYQALLMWGDVGQANFYLGPDGVTRWDWDCA